MAKRSRRSSHRRTKRRSVRSTRSRRHHRARHTRRRGKRMCGGVWPVGAFHQYMLNEAGANHGPRPVIDYSDKPASLTPAQVAANEELRHSNMSHGET
jgi:hypothetical protein